MANEIFISYSRKDSDIALHLVTQLKDYGVDPWFDADDIPAAVPWRDEMLLGVQVCQSFLFLISPNSVTSKPCNDELACALRHNKRLIPGAIKPCSDKSNIHPSLKELNWLRFDKDFAKSFDQLLKLINAPKGALHNLVERPSAFLRLVNSDDSFFDFPLNRNCYWIGRRPQPDDRIAGAIIIPDPNPKSPITSRLHLEVKVVDSKWYAFNRSEKNGIIIYPPSPSGLLRDGSKIFVGHCYLVYKEIQKPFEERAFTDEHPTYTGEDSPD
jgi:hypothetical protein